MTPGRGARRARHAILLALAAAPLAAGCGGDGPPRVTRPPEPVYCPRDAQAGDRFDARELLRLDEDRAADIAERHGCRFRVTSRDGDSLPGTADLNLERINATVEDGWVVGVTVG